MHFQSVSVGLLLAAALLPSGIARASDEGDRELTRTFSDFHVAQKDYGAAEQQLTEHLNGDPADSGAWHYLGLVQELEGQPRKAVESFDHAARVAPAEDRGIHLYAKADALASAGDVAGAESALNAAAAEPVSAWSARHALGSLQSGQSLPEFVPVHPGELEARLSVTSGYDTNVLLASETSLANATATGVASPRAGFAGEANYHKPGFLGGDLHADTSAATELQTTSKASSLSTLNFGAGAEWRRSSFNLGPVSYAFADRATLAFVNTSGFGFYSWDDTVSWKGTLNNGFGRETTFELPLRFQKFAVAATDAAADDRTGLALGAKATHRLRYAGNSFSAGGAFERAFANGDNYRSYSFSIPLGWQRAALPWWQLGASATVTPTLLRYPSSNTDRKDTNLTVTLALNRRFENRVSGSLDYLYAKNPSSLERATYNKHSLAIRVNYDLL